MRQWQVAQPWWRQESYNKFISFAPSLLVGLVIWFSISPSDELTPTAIHLLAVFVSCIVAMVTTNTDISVIVMTALIVLSLTRSFQCEDHRTGLNIECRLCGEIESGSGMIYQCNGAKDAFDQALKGFSSRVVWLIFAAFHLGKAVEVTQLGHRVSLMMIKTFGKHMLGLGYAIVLSELMLGPFVPSNTARGGGIILPVVHSIVKTLGSTPTHNSEIGEFLILVGSHANLISASMYLTGMAPNPIVLAKATQLYPDLNFNFMTWLSGSSVPSITCILCLPLILWYFCGLDKKSTKLKPGESFSSGIIQHAKDELDLIGPMSFKESSLCCILFMCLCLWITSGYTQLDPTLVALMGVCLLVHTGTMTWRDVSTNTTAWESFFWLGGFVTIAQELSEAGTSAFLGHKISLAIVHFHLPAVPSLAIAYFLTSFMFSSLSTHIVAFVGTFLDAGHALGVSPMVFIGLLAYFGALGGLSTMYYSLGYVSRPKWFTVGFTLALFYLLVYFTLGMAWWKILGWY
ncbi:Sodium/sulfate symporter [Spinellus fusiger]|nr:Sodium/sulfate symporter [Spinellus fusiger]